MSTMINRFTSADNLAEMVETGFMIRRRLLQFVLLTLAISLAIALYVKPNYVASSQMVVLPSDEYTFHGSAGSHSLANEALSLENMLDSEVAIIRSPALAHEIIAEVGVKTLFPALARKPNMVSRLITAVHNFIIPPKPTGGDDRIERAVPLFESHLGAVAGAENDVITISFANPKAAVAQQVVATLQTLYLERRRSIFTDRQSRAVATAVADQRKTLAAAEARLTTFQTAHSVTQFQTRESILLSQQGQMEQDLTATQSNIAQLTTSIATLDHAHRSVPRSIALQQSTNIDERTMSLRTSLDALRSKLASMLSNYRKDSPEVRNLRQQISTETALLAHSTANGAPSSLESGQNPVYGQVNLDLMQDTTALAAARIRATQDSTGLAHIAAQLTKLDALKAQLGSLERQQNLAASDYADATKTLSERQLVEQVDAEKRANVRVLSPPFLPLNPFPLRKLIMLAGGVITLFGIIMIVILSNFFRSGALFGRVLEADTGIPLLGVIPELEVGQLLQIKASR